MAVGLVLTAGAAAAATAERPRTGAGPVSAVEADTAAGLGADDGRLAEATGGDTPRAVTTGLRVASANHSGFDDDAAVPLVDGRTYFVGQRLKRDTGVAANEKLDLVRSGTLISLVFADGAGVARIDTGRLQVGRYTLRDQSGTEIASFRLASQTLDLSFDTGTVRTADSNPVASLTVRTNRRSPVYYLTATRDGESVDSNTLQTVFGGTGTTLNDDVLRVTASNVEAYTLNFSRVSAGNFTLRANAPDTDASASATIRIRGDRPGTASFSPRVSQGTAGDEIEIGISLQRTRRADLQLGSDDLSYNVTMTVTDGDGDGQVVVRWNTSRAGTTTEHTAFSTTDSADSVTNVSRTTGRLSQPLSPDTYPASLSVDGREVAVGSITLTAPSSSRVCDRDRTALVQRYHDNADALPSFANGVVTDETIHLIVNGGSQTEYTVVTDANKRISTVEAGAPTNATVEVETDCETITAIADARNPGDVASREYDNGEIAIRGTTLLKSLVIEVGELVYDLGRSLGTV